MLWPLLGKEDTCALQHYSSGRASEGIFEPLRPFHVEVDIVISPHDQPRHVQGPQLRFNPHRVFVVEGLNEALEVTRPLLSTNVRLEGPIDGLAIGEGDRAHSLRKYRRKDLADPASAVVANQIHPVDLQRI